MKFSKTVSYEVNLHIQRYFYYLKFFPGATFLIREGNAYFLSKYSLFDGMGNANLRAMSNVYAKCSKSYIFSGATSIPESRVSKFWSKRGEILIFVNNGLL